MSDVVIKVENLGKQYRLGQVGTGTLSHDLNRLWYKALGKDDPYLKIGETNDRSVKGESDLVWVLKDINFEVKRGEVLGIIGKNGAGKSTLLKILSQVTGPTVGEIKVKGRIASLLEVGTGFHPELTGRENIYLNGAILGMTKAEIKSKFDEIVDFSGVERYIDTPVKRYSSGMYVRLAFAVAAHLEPEILIVDEVLAVGDLEFQKKCLGKMKSVSGQGRTVLFVSHNMEAVQNLCSKAILLKNGMLAEYGMVDNLIKKYLNEGNEVTRSINLIDRKDREGTGAHRFEKVWFTNSHNEEVNFFRSGEDLNIHVIIKKIADNQINKCYPAIIIKDFSGNRLLTLACSLVNREIELDESTEVVWNWKKCPLTIGKYLCNLGMIENPVIGHYIDFVQDAFSLEILSGDYFGTGISQGMGVDKIYTEYSVYKKQK